MKQTTTQWLQTYKMINSYLKVISKSSFKYLWASQILSQITINMLNFIILINLFEMTRSTIATSLLWISYALPALIFGPLAAVVVDIYSRRKLLVYTNLAQAVLITLFSFSRPEGVYLYFAVAFMYSLINQFYVPAEAASLPGLVKDKDLPSANSLFFLTQQTAIIIGYGLAGPLNALVGFKNSFLLSGGLMFLAFLFVTRIRVLITPKSPSSKFEGKLMAYFRNIYDGYRFIKDNRYILLPFFLLLGIYASLAVIIVNVPIIADAILRVPLKYAGLYIVIPSVFGALFGAIYVPYALRKGSRKKTIIENALKVAAVSLLALSLGIFGTNSTLRLSVSMLLLIAIGYSYVGILIPAQTFLQEATPGGLRGRVFGNFWFIATAVNIVPVIFSGAISELLGIRVLLTIMGLAAAFTYVLARQNIDLNSNGKK